MIAGGAYGRREETESAPAARVGVGPPREIHDERRSASA